MATIFTESKGASNSDGNDSISSDQNSQTKTSLTSLELGEAPDGGARAWLVAAGGFAIAFCCLGFSNSFGAFEEYYLTHQLRGQSANNVAWIGALSSFLQFAAGMLGGPLFDRYGAWIIRPAAVAYVVAIMLLSLCREYWQILLVQGILMGTIMGLLQFPAFAAVSQYFEKKRAAALGLVISGSSVGGIVFPIALSKMLNSPSLGFEWSVRIIGFLVIPFMAFACVTIKARLPSRTTTFWITAAYREHGFVLLILSMFFIFVGMLTPLFYLPTYAVTRGMDPTLADYLLAIVNAASTFGRIIPGMLADRYGRLNVYTLGGLVTGIIIFCMNSVTTNAAIIVYSMFFGFASGTIISGASAALSVCPKDPRDTGTYLGMGLSVAGLGSLVGPPINGALITRYGGFSEVSILSGAVCLLGGGIAIVNKALTSQGLLGRA